MTAPVPSSPQDRSPRTRRRLLLVTVGAVGVLVAAVLAFGVFEVQALFTDDEVAEAGPVFESGAVAPTGPIGPGGEEGDATEPAPSIPPAVPEVTVASSGTFVEKGHPGEGTARILTDGAQAFVRFEDDFATDNGPDLRVRALVDGEQVDLGVLKGNRGAQNYELPAHIDPTAVTSVDVWCRRFDYVFTEAALS